MPTGRLIVAALAGTLFFRMLGVFVILPVAAVAVGAMKDATPLLAGLALGGYGLTQALMQMPIGALSDRWGRKPTLLAALALFTGGGFWAAAADDIVGVIIGRLLQGAGAVASVAAAWIADVTEDSRRARAMAVFGAAIAAAFVLSLLIASPLAARIELDGVFAVAGCLGAASLLLTSLLPSPPPPDRPATLRMPPPTPALRRCAGGAFALHYAMAAMFLLLPTALLPYSPAAAHWRVYAGGFALSLLLSLPMLTLADKRKAIVMPTAIGAVIAGAALLLAVADAASAVIALFFFFGGFVVLEALLPAIATRIAPPQHRAAAVGYVMTAEFAGVFLGGGITGFLRQTINDTIAILVVCALLLLWLIFANKRQ